MKKISLYVCNDGRCFLKKKYLLEAGYGVGDYTYVSFSEVYDFKGLQIASIVIAAIVSFFSLICKGAPQQIAWFTLGILAEIVAVISGFRGYIINKDLSDRYTDIYYVLKSKEIKDVSDN